MNEQFYKRCKWVMKTLDLTKEQSIARDCILFNLECYEEQCKDYLNRIYKAIEYLNQPNRDNFDFSKAILLDILQKDYEED